MTSLLDTSTLTNRINLGQALSLRIKDGLTYQEIGERLGCAPSYVYTRLRDFLYVCANPEALRAYQEHKVTLFEEAERLLFLKVIENSPGMANRDLLTAFDLITKHTRLLRGESTANVGLLVGVLEEVHKDVHAAAGATEPKPTKEPTYVPTADPVPDQPVSVGV